MQVQELLNCKDYRKGQSSSDGWPFLYNLDRVPEITSEMWEILVKMRSIGIESEKKGVI